MQINITGHYIWEGLRWSKFHNTFKLREHVRKSARCRSVYYHADLPVVESAEIVGRRLDKSWRAPAPACGPQTFWAQLEPVQPFIDELDGTPGVDSLHEEVALKALIKSCAEGRTWRVWTEEAWDFFRLFHHQFEGVVTSCQDGEVLSWLSVLDLFRMLAEAGFDTRGAELQHSIFCARADGRRI